MQISTALEATLRREFFFCPQEKEIGGVQKTNQGASVLVLQPNAPVTCEVRSRAAIARFKSLNCEHSHCRYSHGQALSLNAIIPTHFYAIFWLRKSECFESERFTMSVARVVSRCEKFDDCGCASNGSGYQ